MSKKEKLIKRLFQRPKDFTYDEAKSLLQSFDYEEYNKGKTTGSKVRFYNKTSKKIFYLHRPHPQKVLKAYQVNELINFIKEAREDNNLG